MCDSLAFSLLGPQVCAVLTAPCALRPVRTIASGYRPHTKKVLACFERTPHSLGENEKATAAEQRRKLRSSGLILRAPETAFLRQAQSTSGQEETKTSKLSGSLEK